MSAHRHDPLEFTPDTAVIGLVEQVIGFRTAACFMFVAAGLAVVWLETGAKILMLATIFATVLSASRIAERRARAPGGARPAVYDDEPLQMIAQAMGLPVPKVVIDERRTESVRLRGTVNHPVIMVSPLSLLVWRDRPDIHMVTLTHELGHAWTKDLSRHFLTSTLAVTVALELLITGIGLNEPSRWLIALLTVAAAVSLRSLLRSREHSADIVAAQFLGKEVRDVMPAVHLRGSFFSSVLGTHPTPRQRMKLFEDLRGLLRGLSVCIALFAAATLTFLIFAAAGLLRLLNLDRHTDLDMVVMQLAAVLGGVSVAVTMGWLVAYAAPFIENGPRSWMRSYLGALTLTLVLTRDVPVTRLEGVIWCVILWQGGTVLALGADLAGVLRPDLSVVQIKDKPSYVLAQSVLPFVGWLLLFEGIRFGFLLSGVQVIADLLGRLPVI